MTDPPQKTSAANPETWCDNQPENTLPESAVVELAGTRYDETHDCWDSRVML